MLAATGHLAGDERHGPAGGRGAEVGGAGSDDQWAHDRAPPTGGRDRPTGWDEDDTSGLHFNTRRAGVQGQGDEKMTVNVLLRVLAVIGVVALAVTAAVAGHGQGGGEIAADMCYTINGTNPDRIVEVTDQFGQSRQIRLGSSALVCTLATVDIRPGDANFDDSIKAGDHLKCYTISGTVPGHPNPVVKLVDPIIGGAAGETVNVTSAKYLCTFSDKIRLQ